MSKINRFLFKYRLYIFLPLNLLKYIVIISILDIICENIFIYEFVFMGRNIHQSSRHWVAKRWWSILALFSVLLSLFIIKEWNTSIPIFAIIILFLLFRSIFIEPQTILIKKRYFSLPTKARIALISDLHLGIYKKQRFLEKIVKKINTLHIDYVFIAWDLTYYPRKKDLVSLFAPLNECRFPVYAVLGNHDVERPWYLLRDELVAALRKAKVNFLNNTVVDLPEFILIWLGESRSHEDNVEILERVYSSLPLIVLTHNPQTIKKYNHRHYPDITLCGHTHGWQITLPFLKKITWYFSSKIKAHSWWHVEYNWYKYFITSWVGEVWLPMRLFSPPTIDILYFGERRRSRSAKFKDQLIKYKNSLTSILGPKTGDK